MRDQIGVSDANYQEVFRTDGIISVGLAVSYIAGEEPQPDSRGLELLKRNPQLIRDVKLKLKAEMKGEEDRVVDGKRIYHPSDTKIVRGEQVITFLPWMDQNLARKRQLVFRRRNRPTDPFVLLAREGEEEAWKFERPEDGKFQYVDLDFLFHTPEFKALFIRFVHAGNRPSDYFRADAGLDERRFPTVRVSSVSRDQVPEHLLPRHRQSQKR